MDQLPRPELVEPCFHIVANKRTHMVVERSTGRCLGAVAISYYRPWVFPLYSQRGCTVLQEAPPDHPFHNGFFVGQNPVVAGSTEANFWGTPPKNGEADHLQERVGRMDAAPPRAEAHDRGVRFSIDSVWRDENERPILDERRTIDLYVDGDATVCDMTSEKIAAYGPVRYPATKFGSIGIRAEPRLLPDFGGIVIGDRGRQGRAELVHEQESAFVAYENDVHGYGRVGILMTVLEDSARGVWFVRDYGVATYSPRLDDELVTEEGDAWRVSVRVVAYEASLSEERA